MKDFFKIEVRWRTTEIRLVLKLNNSTANILAVGIIVLSSKLSSVVSYPNQQLSSSRPQRFNLSRIQHLNKSRNEGGCGGVSSAAVLCKRFHKYNSAALIRHKIQRKKKKEKKENRSCMLSWKRILPVTRVRYKLIVWWYNECGCLPQMSRQACACSLLTFCVLANVHLVDGGALDASLGRDGLQIYDFHRFREGNRPSSFQQMLSELWHVGTTIDMYMCVCVCVFELRDTRILLYETNSVIFA